MKKIIIPLLALVMLFSCSERRILKNPETSSPGQEKEIKQENLENKEIVKNEENLEECIKKNPIKDIDSYWAFKNENDGLCYYFGYAWQFFLINENLEKNIKENFKKDLETGYFIKNDNETEEELLKRIYLLFMLHKYNLLYGEKIDKIHDSIFKKYKFHEPPIIALFDEKNILNIYLEKLKELNIILPKNYKKVGEFDEKNLFEMLEGWSKETKNISEKNFVPVPKYFYEINYQKFYEILYELQQKELENL